MHEYLGCRKGWKEFGYSCYFFGGTETINWFSARERCQDSFGSHLATISTKKENDFVGKHLNNKSWLGLRRKANQKFELVREGKASFNAWDSMNNLSSKTGCVAARPTKRLTWRAREYSSKLRYICERPVSRGKNLTNNSQFTLCPEKVLSPPLQLSELHLIFLLSSKLPLIQYLSLIIKYFTNIKSNYISNP